MSETAQSVALAAMRLACLTYHSDFTAEDAVYYATMDVESADYHRLADLAEKVVEKHTDPERMAVERIEAAIQNLTGYRRLVAAYVANGGVLTPADVERIAREP